MIRVIISKINMFRYVCTVINNFMRELFSIDNEHILEIFKEIYNFVFVINLNI